MICTLRMAMINALCHPWTWHSKTRVVIKPVLLIVAKYVYNDDRETESEINKTSNCKDGNFITAHWRIKNNTGRHTVQFLTKSEHWGRFRCRLTSTGIPLIDYYYSEVIMSAMASLITSVSIVCLSVCSGADQENIKAPRHCPLWGEFTGDRWILRTKGQ